MKMESQIRLININEIIPNRFQPRLTFSEEGLQELALSIQEHGIVQPLVLRRAGDKYEIIAGERRFKAAQRAGYTQVPCIITELDDNESAEVAIIENTHRRNLSPIEEAKSYKKLLDRRYVTQDQLAKRLGTSQANIANKVRLLTLDENVQKALTEEKISERHARSLLKVTDKLKQVELLNKIVTERWTVRKLDEEINDILSGYNKGSLTGEINVQNRNDIDINDIMNNSTDILVDDAPDELYTYDAEANKIRKKEKESLFFNNLENESANMNPTLSFGFNPFETKEVKPADGSKQQDYDLLDMDDDQDYDDEEEDIDTLDDDNTSTTSTNDGNVKVVTVEEDYNTKEEVIAGIKKILTKAKLKGIPMQSEEFYFSSSYQMIIRLANETDKK